MSSYYLDTDKKKRNQIIAIVVSAVLLLAIIAGIVAVVLTSKKDEGNGGGGGGGTSPWGPPLKAPKISSITSNGAGSYNDGIISGVSPWDDLNLSVKINPDYSGEKDSIKYNYTWSKINADELKETNNQIPGNQQSDVNVQSIVPEIKDGDGSIIGDTKGSEANENNIDSKVGFVSKPVVLKDDDGEDVVFASYYIRIRVQTILTYKDETAASDWASKDIRIDVNIEDNQVDVNIDKVSLTRTRRALTWAERIEISKDNYDVGLDKSITPKLNNSLFLSGLQDTKNFAVDNADYMAVEVSNPFAPILDENQNPIATNGSYLVAMGMNFRKEKDSGQNLNKIYVGFSRKDGIDRFLYGNTPDDVNIGEHPPIQVSKSISTDQKMLITFQVVKLNNSKSYVIINLIDAATNQSMIGAGNGDLSGVPVEFKNEFPDNYFANFRILGANNTNDGTLKSNSTITINNLIWTRHERLHEAKTYSASEWLGANTGEYMGGDANIDSEGNSLYTTNSDGSATISPGATFNGIGRNYSETVGSLSVQDANKVTVSIKGNPFDGKSEDENFIAWGLHFYTDGFKWNDEVLLTMATVDGDYYAAVNYSTASDYVGRNANEVMGLATDSSKTFADEISLDENGFDIVYDWDSNNDKISISIVGKESTKVFNNICLNPNKNTTRGFIGDFGLYNHDEMISNTDVTISKLKIEYNK